MTHTHTSFDSWLLDNPYQDLSPDFYTPLAPTPIPDPYLVCVSTQAAELIGLTPKDCQQKDFVSVFSGNKVPLHSTPYATVYSGHQFGVWAGQLGDGRAISLGNYTADSGEEWEIQLKGSGKTPYSRMGDGKAVLRSSIREFLCSEAMAALHIPTTRALSVIGSDEAVQRETIETAAVLTRLAPSFIRFGSFEHWSHRQEITHLQWLADHVIQTFYPECLDDQNPYAQLLNIVCEQTAKLIAQWQSVGFMHGVMNTDNMSILGLTLDYGPFGFMDGFDIRHICNHTDVNGRYAFHQQPEVGHWNCFALGQSLLPLIQDTEMIKDALAIYRTTFQTTHHALLRQKLGLQTSDAEDNTLFNQLFRLLQNNTTDFTLFFRRLSHLNLEQNDQDAVLAELFTDQEELKHWLTIYRRRLHLETSQNRDRQLKMLAVNPKYILRNHLVQTAIEKAQQKDFSEIHTLLTILEHPFDEQSQYEKYAQIPPDWASQIAVSCSS